MNRIFIIYFLFLFGISNAQSFEPRYLSPAPVGMNIVLFGYGYSYGNILTDSALPIKDVDASLHSFLGAYVRTIDFFGLPGKVDVIVPFSYGYWTGKVYGRDSSTTRVGLVDPMVRLSVTLIGGKVLSPSEFRSYDEDFSLGVAFRVRAPIGQYDETKLINLSTNRWMFKPSIGMAYKLNRWIFELHFNAWFFTTNNKFFNGNKLQQNPLYSGQLHVIYSFKAGFWGAVSFGLTSGGRTILNDIYKDDTQLSQRIGALLVFPVSQKHSIKIGFVSGVSTRYGADFDSVGLTYQYRWF